VADTITTAAAVEHWVNSLEAERAREDLPEVERFASWFGPSRPLDTLTPGDLARYRAIEQARLGDGDPLDHLEILRAFFAYTTRLSFTASDIVPALNLPGVPAPRGANDQLGGDAYYVTIEGLAALEREVDELRAERPRIADDLRAAMADKDFRENAPLDAARDAQAHLEARIRAIESQLRHAVIIDADAKAGRANVGSTVRVLNLKGEREQTFHLVSPNEVDPTNGKISVESPVGQAVINHRPGDEVTVKAPSGELHLRVLEVIG
jgi:transcription elongation factor GreA